MNKKLFKFFALALLIAFIANILAISNCFADDDDEFETPPIVDGPDCLSHSNPTPIDNANHNFLNIILDWFISIINFI